MNVEHQLKSLLALPRETVKAALVKPTNPGSKSKKHAQYVPFWL